MTVYRAVYDAVVEALAQLERNGHGSNAVVYVHPNIWGDALRDTENYYQRVGEPPRIVGCDVVKYPTLPENVVMVVDVERAAFTKEAIAFSTLENMGDRR